MSMQKAWRSNTTSDYSPSQLIMMVELKTMTHHFQFYPWSTFRKFLSWRWSHNTAPGLACNIYFSRQGSKLWVRARKWPPRSRQTRKHRQIRSLRDPNPMEDVPDKDSAKIREIEFKLYFACPSNPGFLGTYHVSPCPYCQSRIQGTSIPWSKHCMCHCLVGFLPFVRWTIMETFSVVWIQRFLVLHNFSVENQRFHVI